METHTETLSTNYLLAEMLEVMKEQRPKKYLNAQGIADLIGVSKSTAQGSIMVAEGFPLPCKLPNGTKRWVRAEVEAWIERWR